MDKTALGNRMKMYEGQESDRRFMPLLPIIARLDGRNFSAFTRDLRRPYDERLSDLMVDTTRHLVTECGGTCLVGYTQSDEITLVFYADRPDRQVFFDGRVQKLTSTLAALATAQFHRALPCYFNDPDPLLARMPTFDCRVWQVPNLTEAANCLLWRERDATKNSITMAALSHYSHKALHGKDGDEKQEMLHQKGVNWNDYPAFFKRGTYVARRTSREPFTAEELEALPPRHHARTNPDLVVERMRIEMLDLPPLGSIANREGALFGGEEYAIRRLEGVNERGASG